MDLLKQWYSSLGSSSGLDDAKRVVDQMADKPMQDVLSQPLLLALVVAIDVDRRTDGLERGLPASRVSILDEAVQLYIRRYYRMHKPRVPPAKVSELNSRIVTWLAKIAYRNLGAYSVPLTYPELNPEFHNIALRSGILQRCRTKGERFSLSMLSDYLAALHMSRIASGIDVRDLLEDARKREVVRFLSALMDDPTEIIAHCLSKPSTIELGVRCVMDHAKRPALTVYARNLALEWLQKNELFDLGVDVLTELRVCGLVRSAPNRCVDLGLISEAEYLRFTREQATLGFDYTLDHLERNAASRDLGQPVRGVRYLDASRYCEWLTDRRRCDASPYIIPRASDVGSVPEKGLCQSGFWIDNGGDGEVTSCEFAILPKAGITPSDVVQQLAIKFPLIRSIACEVSDAINRTAGSPIDKVLGTMIGEVTLLCLSQFDAIRSLYFDIETTFRKELSGLPRRDTWHTFRSASVERSEILLSDSFFNHLDYISRQTLRDAQRSTEIEEISRAILNGERSLLEDSVLAAEWMTYVNADVRRMRAAIEECVQHASAAIVEATNMTGFDANHGDDAFRRRRIVECMRSIEDRLRSLKERGKDLGALADVLSKCIRTKSRYGVNISIVREDLMNSLLGYLAAVNENHYIHRSGVGVIAGLVAIELRRGGLLLPLGGIRLSQQITVLA